MGIILYYNRFVKGVFGTAAKKQDKPSGKFSFCDKIPLFSQIRPHLNNLLGSFDKQNPPFMR